MLWQINGGFEGDRYPQSGFYSCKRIPDEDRGLVIISSQAIAEGNIELTKGGFGPYEWGDLRRSIVADIPNQELSSLKDKVFKIGEVVVVGMDPCTPCLRLGQLSGRPIVEQQAFVKVFLSRGGLRVKVLNGGIISVGSKIEVPEQPSI
ncbi:hypothetical protein A2715_05485 [Candidatus Woesebacteria bacterium RIFCSPHIGHO2_01_FULL_39_32]|uniref:MOSC domain-containing protein n=1 Tax=Candidatus Woesebacteria bacterium RIFCSPLOWO2_01_FULL_39_25 TaxID=1802521 RepID=A0A1F8BLT1_9BACT|nr:MAG: hypothetical protein A2124_03930 [Candidatus Woesebacteria bacterium GWB1_37_5]OGM25472.1 MAG: hypothetical protein A2715_05485 [Candidatus Woesebacteria bacterium RIFCSPHIGHO2_01_FULL_39_32]OGM38575.1 MAG: hypothetical protein A3F01_04440 [Candidatus Woesebacteria bacterium RIFCSPHIGHO2_12_FULL_38_11]OGM65003.1 MAG: hypothetical protein A2893_05095 [Candidatus Woesebacteria bacterium RIFCSPLOWO2_01_FULL_39_25]